MSSSTDSGAALRTVVAAYDDPESVRFVDAVQEFYRERYGGPDRTPVDPAEFTAPRGVFLLGLLGDTPVCCGGWRRHDASTIAPADVGALRPGDAEIKRMWVDPEHRRRGFARRMLVELEAAAATAGCGRTVLETGDRQPEATALYRAVGYTPVPAFGVYREEPGCLCLARPLRPRADRGVSVPGCSPP